MQRSGTRGSVPEINFEESILEVADPREIDTLLAEMVQISGRWELYRKFLYLRLVVRENFRQSLPRF